jgi:phosphate starvation-inducible membrane PsiE
MRDAESTLAAVLFWLFAAITAVATFLIADHHGSRRMALVLAATVLILFVLLFAGLRVFLRSLGL